jgi:DNA mismatch repair protein MutS2
MTLQDASNKLDLAVVLQGVMHYASSDLGRDQVQRIAPIADRKALRDELATTTEMKRLLEREEGLSLEGLKSIHPAVQKSRIEGAVLMPRELGEIFQTTRCAREVRVFLHSRREEYPRVWSRAQALAINKVLEFNIAQAIDETFEIKDTASKELKELRRAIGDSYEHLKRRLSGILKSVAEKGVAQEEIITTREGRMVIPVKSEQRSKVPGFVHSASASGATVFVEPAETLELNNEIRSLQFREQREIDRILRQLTDQVREVAENLLASVDILTTLDVLQAKARYSVEIMGNEPHIDEDCPLRLVQARHPVLLRHHGYEATVPLDIELGKEYRTMLISGPNAGGKSVALKTVGLLVLMTLSGMHIPASADSDVPLVEGLFVDIGDDQSIESDLSTFSSHLAHLREIVGQVSARSLVLIDEIGSGTDPAEGGAIAAAVLERLTHDSVLTVATTHQGSLKVFAYETEGMQNGAMEFDQETLTPTYRFRAGVPGSSYAFPLASRQGFSRELLDRARELLGAPQASMDRLIIDLEAAAQRYKHEFEVLQAEKVAVETRARHYEEKITQLGAELKETKRKALEEANRIVDGAHALIEKTVRDIRERGAEKVTIKEAREQVDLLKKSITEQRAQQEPEHRVSAVVTVGARVTLADATAVGIVESITTDGQHAVVALGSVRMKVPVRDLVVTDARDRAPVTHDLSTQIPQGELQREIDVRGLTGDEAIPLVDKFIDDATLRGLTRLTIIHGKGTGALRKKVSEFLARDPRVKSSTIAEWHEGGMGATVVELNE